MEIGRMILSEQQAVSLIGCLVLSMVCAFWLAAIRRKMADPQAIRAAFWQLQVLMGLSGLAIIVFPDVALAAFALGLLSCGGLLINLSRQQLAPASIKG